MPSFDVVNKIDLQEVDNAINNTKKEVNTRYDFRGTNTEVSFDKKEKKLSFATADDFKMKALKEMFIGNCVKRGLDTKSFKYGEVEPTTKGHVKMAVDIQEGIEKDIARKIVKLIKDQKMKVQAAIQDEQVRVTAKKIDDLQTVIQLLKDADLDIPLQYVNMKS
jgi:cyclic-di-GMP-binding protein